MAIAVYPGTFDPITYGHIDIIVRAAKIYDEVVIGVLENLAKTPLFSAEERVNIVQEAIDDIPNVRVAAFDGLAVDFARQNHAAVILRGLRLITDFEYELQMAHTNRKLAPDVDTSFLFTSLEYSYVSSTNVREIAKFGGDVSELVPDYVARELHRKIAEETTQAEG